MPSLNFIHATEAREVLDLGETKEVLQLTQAS